MTSVQILPREGGGYTATVSGVTLIVDSYVAEPGPNGRAIVSLAVEADSLQIGVPPARRSDLEQTRHLNQAPISTWGDPSQPDPRAKIPGWQPPPDRVDAHRGRSREYPIVPDRRAQ